MHPVSLPAGLRLGLLYAVIFAGIGVAMPFLPLWLASLSLGPDLIGALVALPIAVKIGATAPLMALIDRGVTARALLVAGSLGLALTYGAMPAAATFGWPILALVIALNAVAGAPLVPAVDYLSLAAVRRDPRLDYARIRLGGSLGFLAASLAGGWLLGLIGERAGVTAFLAGLGLVSAAGSALLTTGAAGERISGPEPRPAGAAGLPVALWLAMAAGASIQASHAAVYAFGSIHWAGLGLSSPMIGAAWAIGVVAEIVFFALVGRVPTLRDAPFRLLALGAVAALLRWAGLAGLAAVPATVLPLQILHGLTFGATQLGAMGALSRLAPEGARGRAQGAYAAAAALASACATLASGAAVRAGGPLLAFALMVPAAGLGLALTLAAARRAGARTRPVRPRDGHPAERV
ncbi:MFS transporter [Methylobacterium nodulans]|uniref:Major facilitator superfamily MFS_1 n=1 Tax=Methylobacterium nodulans (strain LMG 21967 / CNCM I-2342 / ORS 2060) TaxID=460265 RepID=B8IHC5_METNO|nr:MFS transporter [Methylobacterium nodulans]ACL59817.1 major facilitator superfamily MFS_1 [Methylobacterium nodulans ORS 2060]